MKKSRPKAPALLCFGRNDCQLGEPHVASGYAGLLSRTRQQPTSRKLHAPVARTGWTRITDMNEDLYQVAIRSAIDDELERDKPDRARRP